MIKIALASFFMLVLVGCAPSYQTRVYDVTVKNKSTGPITLWLTKSGAPFEEGWLAPEDLAVQSPKSPPKAIGGVVVPAGMTASTGPRQGQFDATTRAILRIYGGQLTFDQLLASSSEQKNRVDLDLRQGVSGYVVTGDSGAIRVKEMEASEKP